jgi:hypothetical protein
MLDSAEKAALVGNSTLSRPENVEKSALVGNLSKGEGHLSKRRRAPYVSASRR